MKSNSGHPSGSAGAKFYRRGSFIKTLYPKTVAVVRPGVRVTVREEDPDFKFSGTSRCVKVLSRILRDPAVTRYTNFFCCRRTFSSSHIRIWPSISVWQFIPKPESKLAIRQNLMAKFSVPRSGIVLISKFKF